MNQGLNYIDVLLLYNVILERLSSHFQLSVRWIDLARYLLYELGYMDYTNIAFLYFFDQRDLKIMNPLQYISEALMKPSKIDVGWMVK